MTSTITIHYRINIHDGFLFDSELVHGEVVARVQSAKSPLTLEDMDEVVRLCSHAVIGTVQDVNRDEDSIYLSCGLTVE